MKNKNNNMVFGFIVVIALIILVYLGIRASNKTTETQDNETITNDTIQEDVVSENLKTTDYAEEVPSMAKLVTPNPTKNTKTLYNYLEENYGKAILSGQQMGGVSENEVSYEIEVIKKVTGKEPAILGCDFMDYSLSRVERGTVSHDTEKAIEWAKSGGIVTFAWHWNAPSGLIDDGTDSYWWGGFYTDKSTFNIEKALADKDSEEYKLLIKDIDAIAVQLKKLQEEDIPVLWRPLHEASGGWFWWGAFGAKPCIELWQIMFDRLVNYHGINNLIWVWNGQNKDWYPGDEYVDIVSEDIYADNHDYSSQIEKFKVAEKYPDNKKTIVALSENGVIPDPDKLIEDGSKWSWFCTWDRSFVYDEVTKEYSEEKTEKDMIVKVYNHEYVITKDELPNLYGGSDVDYLEKTSVELIKDMKAGWNLGNTLDAITGEQKTGLETETAWGNPYTTKEMIDKISDAGFNTLRVPVSWAQHIDDSGVINKEYMARVREVVDYGMDNDMFVILNTHHEEWIRPEETYFEENKEMLTGIWKQISEEFKYYDGKLIFETMNEPRLRNTDIEWNGGDSASREIINKLNEAAYNVIRESGGNNSKRHIMLPPYGACAYENAWVDYNFIEDTNVIVSIHNYAPYDFALNVTGGDKWGDEAQKADIDNFFARLDKYFISKNVAVIIGESGALNKNNTADRVEWAKYFYGAAHESGIPALWWDNGAVNSGESFALLDRRKLEFIFPEIVDVLCK